MLVRTILAERSRRISLSFGAIAALVMTGYSLTIPNVYTSEAMLLPSGSAGSPLAALAATASLLGRSVGQVDEEAGNPDIIGSRWMGERLLATTFQFTYKKYYFGRTETRNQTLEAFLKVNKPEAHERALRIISRWIAGKRDLKTGILRISATAPSPELAFQMAGKTTEFLNLALKTKARNQATAKAGYALERLSEAKQEAEQARQALEDYAKANQNFMTTADLGIRTRGEGLVAELALRRQVRNTLTLGYEQAKMDAHSTVPVLSVLDSGFLPVEKSGPRRATMVLMAFVLAAGGIWGLLNAKKIKAGLKKIEGGRS